MNVLLEIMAWYQGFWPDYTSKYLLSALCFPTQEAACLRLQLNNHEQPTEPFSIPLVIVKVITQVDIMKPLHRDSKWTCILMIQMFSKKKGKKSNKYKMVG